ncbi:MAG: alpha/beta hydrolase [Erysipelotrichaceae bacterium]|jgi:pimeloyl-ACP methyl ester carboxylesterase|nr:alpha/beta hydrolase [Erysipelotrichaceae bacterium]
MKDKIVKVLKVIGIVVFFPLLLLFWLICVAINAVLTAINKERVNTPLGQYVEINGHRMSVLIKGKGKHTLVFLPGLGSDSPILEFKPLYSKFENEYRIIVPEKFGYGQSDIVEYKRGIKVAVDECREALSKLGIKGPFILCGHSNAGNEIEYWEQNYPDEVEAFIGFDTNLAAFKDDWDFKISFLDKLEIWLFRTAGWNRRINKPGLKKLLNKEDKKLMRYLSNRNSDNYDVLSEVFNFNNVASKSVINEKPLPSQPTLQFVAAPEWYVKGEEGHELDDEDKLWFKAHEDLVNASTNGKIIFLSTGHCLHILDYEKVYEEMDKYIKESLEK